MDPKKPQIIIIVGTKVMSFPRTDQGAAVASDWALDHDAKLPDDVLSNRPMSPPPVDEFLDELESS